MSWKAIKSTDPIKTDAVEALRACAGQNPIVKATILQLAFAKVTNVQRFDGGTLVRGDVMVKLTAGRGGKYTKLGTFSASIVEA